MSAQTLSSPFLRLVTTVPPGPIRTLLRTARLAELPDECEDMRLDTMHESGATKHLLVFRAPRAEINRFLLTSPALNECAPQPFPFAGDGDAYPGEPHIDWWNPEQRPGRRYCFDTPAFDFVEVIVDDERTTVFVRTID